MRKVWFFGKIWILWSISGNVLPSDQVHASMAHILATGKELPQEECVGGNFYIFEISEPISMFKKNNTCFMGVLKWILEIFSIMFYFFIKENIWEISLLTMKSGRSELRYLFRTHFIFMENCIKILTPNQDVFRFPNLSGPWQLGGSSCRAGETGQFGESETNRRGFVRTLLGWPQNARP